MDRRGLTLVEVLIGVGLGMASMLALYSVLEYSNRHTMTLSEEEDVEEMLSKATYALTMMFSQAVNLEARFEDNSRICTGATNCGHFCSLAGGVRPLPSSESTGYSHYPPKHCLPGAGEIRMQWLTSPNAALPYDSLGYDSTQLLCGNTQAAQAAGAAPPNYCVDTLAIFNREAANAIDKTNAQSEFRQTGIFFQRPDRGRSGVLYIDRGQAGVISPDTTDTTFTRLVSVRYELQTEPAPHVLYLIQTPQGVARDYLITVAGTACGAVYTAPANASVATVLGELVNRVNGNATCAAAVTANTGVSDSLVLDFVGARVPVTYTNTLAEWAYLPRTIKFTLTARKFLDASQRANFNFDVVPPAGTAAFTDVSQTVSIDFRNVKFGSASGDTNKIDPERLHGNLYYFQFVPPKKLRWFDF